MSNRSTKAAVPRKLKPCTFPGCTKSFRLQAGLDQHLATLVHEKDGMNLKAPCGKACSGTIGIAHHRAACKIQGCGQRRAVPATVPVAVPDAQDDFRSIVHDISKAPPVAPVPDTSPANSSSPVIGDGDGAALDLLAEQLSPGGTASPSGGRSPSPLPAFIDLALDESASTIQSHSANGTSSSTGVDPEPLLTTPNNNYPRRECDLPPRPPTPITLPTMTPLFKTVDVRLYNPTDRTLIIPSCCDFGYARRAARDDLAAELRSALSPQYPEDLPSDHIANRRGLWRKPSSGSVAPTIPDWRKLVADYLFTEGPCRLTLRGNEKVFAFDLPLPVSVQRQRFECSTHAHLTKRQFDPRSNRSVTSMLHSATITQSHPDFNTIPGEIPAGTMKTQPYFTFNSTMVSEDIYRDIVTQLQIHPCIRAAAASILNRYTDNYNALVQLRRQQREAKLVDDSPVSDKDQARFRAMCLTGIGRDTVGLVMRHWWHNECQQHSRDVYNDVFARPMLRLSLDTTFKSVAAVTIARSRPARVLTIDPSCGLCNAAVTVRLNGDKLGETRDDVVKVTINGVACKYNWAPRSTENEASLVCVIPPLGDPVSCPEDGLTFDVVVTTISSGNVAGSCDMRYTYLPSNHKDPTNYPPKYNPRVKGYRNQQLREKCTVRLQTIMDGDIVVWCQMTPDDRATYACDALENIILHQLRRAGSQASAIQAAGKDGKGEKQPSTETLTPVSLVSGRPLMKTYTPFPFAPSPDGRILSPPPSCTEAASGRISSNLKQVRTLPTQVEAALVRVFYVDNIKASYNGLEAAYDNARCRYLEIPNVGIPKVDMVILQDIFHVSQRITRTMRKKHPEYAAARARLKDIFQNVLHGRYTRPSDYTTALMAWVTEYEKPTASITRSERQSVDAAVRELFTPEQLKAIEADSKSTGMVPGLSLSSNPEVPSADTSHPVVAVESRGDDTTEGGSGYTAAEQEDDEDPEVKTIKYGVLRPDARKVAMSQTTEPVLSGIFRTKEFRDQFKAAGTNLNESLHRWLGSRRTAIPGTCHYDTTVMWIMLWILQWNRTRLIEAKQKEYDAKKSKSNPDDKKKRVRDPVLDPSARNAYYLPVSPVAVGRMHVSYERMDTPWYDLHAMGHTIGKPNKSWRLEEKRFLATALHDVRFNSVTDRSLWRYIANHYMDKIGGNKTQKQVAKAIQFIIGQVPGWRRQDIFSEDADTQPLDISNRGTDSPVVSSSWLKRSRRTDMSDSDSEDETSRANSPQPRATSPALGDETMPKIERSRQLPQLFHLDFRQPPPSDMSPAPASTSVSPKRRLGNYPRYRANSSRYQESFVVGHRTGDGKPLRALKNHRRLENTDDILLRMSDDVPKPGVSTSRARSPKQQRISSVSGRIPSTAQPLPHRKQTTSQRRGESAFSRAFSFPVAPAKKKDKPMTEEEAVEESKQWSMARDDPLLHSRLWAAGLFARGEMWVKRDGNCLYWALADQIVSSGMLIGGGIEQSITGDETKPIPRGVWLTDPDVRARCWPIVKQHVLTVIKNDAELLMQLNACPVGQEAKHDDFAKHEQDGTHGNTICIVAAATHYRRTILVFHSARHGGRHWVAPTKHEPRAGGPPPPKFDQLCLCSWGNHFGSARPLHDP